MSIKVFFPHDQVHVNPMASKSLHGYLCLLFFLLVMELAPNVDARWYDLFSRKRDPDDPRVFKTGRGGELTISRGDTVITGLWPNKRVLNPPFRWMYAVDNRGTVIHFLPRFYKLFKNVKPVLLDVPNRYKKTKVQNRGKKKGHIGDVGSLVAALLYESSKQHKLKYHFNLFFCNCKHYVEYLSLGKVGGSWDQVMYHRMDKKCPLRAPLHPGLFYDIWGTRSFTLEDGKKVKIRLQIDEWPDYVHDVQEPKP